MNKVLKNVLPYAALLLCFGVYMQYWANVTGQCPHFCNRGYDDFAYRDDFMGLLNGSWPGQIVFYQSPLPAHYLRLVYSIFQHPIDNFAIPYLINIFLATLTAGLIYKIAQETFSRYAGIVTVLFWGFYEFVKFYATTIEANLLIAFFLTAALYFLLKYEQHHHKAFLLITPICLGFAVLGRTNNLIILGAIGLWFILCKIPFKELIVRMGVLCLITLVIILPAIYHSSQAAGRFVLVTDTGVFNFTMGNLPNAPGTYWDQALHSLEPTIRFISQQPLDWLQLTLRKFRLFFTFPWSPARLHELPFYSIILWLIVTLCFFFYFFRTFSARRSLLHLSLLFYTGSIVIAHVEDEYRIPVLPLIFLFLSVAMISLIKNLYKTGSKIYNGIIQLQIQKPAAIFIWSGLVVAIFLGQIPGSQVSAKVDSIKGEAVYNGVTVGQTFQIGCPRLYQIKVKMFSLNPHGAIAFHLKEGSMDGSEVFSQIIPTADLNYFDYHTITFPEISASAGKEYTFYFDTSSLKSADEGLFFAGGRHPFAESLNRLEPSQRIVGGAFVSLGNLDGNLAFAALCHTNPLELTHTAIDQLAKKTAMPHIVKPMLATLLIAHGLASLGSLIFIIIKIYSPGSH